jgi:hypothetical protein
METQDLSELASPRDTEAVTHMRQAIASGQHWYLALLEAINLWETAEEVHNGRNYRYLIGSEAFDWLLLTERLLELAGENIPDEERANLICRGRPPLQVNVETFKELIGCLKYRQFLNYFYGITVEEALIQAVTEALMKEWQPLGLPKLVECDSEVYQRIYGQDEAALLKQFRVEKGLIQQNYINLTEIKEFTYWLFKYRVKHCDKAKVASDTKKALDQLHSLGYYNLMLNEETQRRGAYET